MKINFIGHSAFYIEEGNLKALIDPFLTGNETTTKSVTDYDSITHIFVTHGHEDHLGDTIELAKLSNATVICNFEITNYLNKFGITTHPMHIGGRTKFEFGTVKMTPALHGSGILEDGEMICGGNPCGFVIKTSDASIYHAGDTGLTMDMQLLKIEELDLAIVPIGGNFTMDTYDAARAVDFIDPKKVIPIHYNTFPIISADPYEFKSLVNTNIEVCILNPGGSIIID